LLSLTPSTVFGEQTRITALGNEETTFEYDVNGNRTKEDCAPLLKNFAEGNKLEY
jgi:hypothetical protein